jgi:hypothetical protein
MGIALHINCPPGGDDYLPIVGVNQLKAVWIPIIERLQLHNLELSFNCGMSLNQDIYRIYLKEMIILGHELEKAYPTFREERTPATSWNEAIEIVKNNPPGHEGSYDLDIG